jgi:hypothetical protein
LDWWLGVDKFGEAERQLFTAETSKIVAFGLVELSGMSSAGAERQLFTAEASKIVAFWPMELSWKNSAWRKGNYLPPKLRK